jgi:hypothetical protein
MHGIPFRCISICIVPIGLMVATACGPDQVTEAVGGAAPDSDEVAGDDHQDSEQAPECADHTTYQITARDYDLSFGGTMGLQLLGDEGVLTAELTDGKQNACELTTHFKPRGDHGLPWLSVKSAHIPHNWEYPDTLWRGRMIMRATVPADCSAFELTAFTELDAADLAEDSNVSLQYFCDELAKTVNAVCQPCENEDRTCIELETFYEATPSDLSLTSIDEVQSGCD